MVSNVKTMHWGCRVTTLDAAAGKQPRWCPGCRRAWVIGVFERPAIKANEYRGNIKVFSGDSNYGCCQNPTVIFRNAEMWISTFVVRSQDKNACFLQDGKLIA